PYIITIHMFLAVILLFGLLYLRKFCIDLKDTSLGLQTDHKAYTLTRWLVRITFVQILMGSQVRQEVDHLMRDTSQASHLTVVEQLGWIFYIHRSFSFIIIGLFLHLLFYFQKG